jgi:hypothetical protein
MNLTGSKTHKSHWIKKTWISLAQKTTSESHWLQSNPWISLAQKHMNLIGSKTYESHWLKSYTWISLAKKYMNLIGSKNNKWISLASKQPMNLIGIKTYESHWLKSNTWITLAQKLHMNLIGSKATHESHCIKNEFAVPFFPQLSPPGLFISKMSHIDFLLFWDKFWILTLWLPHPVLTGFGHRLT